LASTDDVTTEIRTLLQNQYANPLPPQALSENSIQAMLADLKDPYTLYMDKGKYKDFLDMLEMKFSGIGIYADIVPQGVLVTGTIPGSPAELAGLAKGDVIMDADNHKLAGLLQEEALGYLRRPEGSQADLTVLEGTDLKRVLVDRASISLPDVTGEVRDGHIGYLVINLFGQNTSADFKQEVLRLQGLKVDSWIVDLRNNPGGYLNTALDMAGYFIGPSGTVQVRDKTGNTTLYSAQRQSFVLNQPMVFLTNENTASAAEILSAAEQDRQKGILVGTKTFGKGSVQGVFSLSGGGSAEDDRRAFLFSVGTHH
jgi:carboxyl-terminal processing protease